MNIYIGNLNYRVREDDLKQVMEAYGAVDSVKIIKDRETGKSKGFGFVEMADVKDGQTAIKEIDGKEVGGRKLNVNQARERDDSRPRGGSDGGGSFRRSY